MTLDQISLATECIELTRIKHLEMLIQPLMQGLGGKYKGGKLKRDGKVVSRGSGQTFSKNRQGGTDMRPYNNKDGEGTLRSGFAFLNIPIHKK